MAADTFGRTVATGFGAADVGGPWRTDPAEASYAVGDGVGRITLPRPGAHADVSLPAVSSEDTDLLLSLAPDAPLTGGGLYVAASARRVAGVGEYRTRVQLRPDGAVVLTLGRMADGVGRDGTHRTTIRGLRLTDGQRLMLRTQVTGTDPTRVRARVWRSGTPEPTDWQLAIKDGTRPLQGPGSVGVNLRLSRTADGPADVLLDDLTVRTP